MIKEIFAAFPKKMALPAAWQETNFQMFRLMNNGGDDMAVKEDGTKINCFCSLC